ncbi:MAG: isoprenylcysteine carboxylmethyltransferase family protein [Nitrospirae bacterium]|nr:isoprenylcysteine carboxylmethyltransferase family protein [Nitrospirota bacterium]
MSIINMRPPIIAIVLTLLAASLHWGLHIGETVWFSMPWAGVLLGIAGFLVMMWAWSLFKQQDLALCPTAKTEHITTKGPFRFTRNPMYLGMVLIMLGLSLYFGTLPFYISATVFFAVLNIVFCPYEENKLAEAFGDEYMHYRTRVRRWL